MPRLVHFEINVDDPDRAMAFYRDLFGWEFQQFGPDYWLVTTGKAPEPGIDGGLNRRTWGGAAGDRIVAYVGVVDVPDIDAYMAKAIALGAPIVEGKREVPGIGWSAYFKDTEDNVFGIFQSAGP
jgi:predicted enzyme related to lactoylglutathione lyase